MGWRLARRGGRPGTPAKTPRRTAQGTTPRATRRNAAHAVHARTAAVDSRRLAALRLAGRRLRPARRTLQAYALRLEEAVRPARPGRLDGSAARSAHRQPPARHHQTHHSTAQAVASRLGLPANQRHAL